jgi:hypothetical protein
VLIVGVAYNDGILRKYDYGLARALYLDISRYKLLANNGNRSKGGSYGKKYDCCDRDSSAVCVSYGVFLLSGQT